MGRAACARVALTGGLLLGLSTFQAEFDFGVPQFRLVFQPMLIMLAAGVALVAARICARPRRRARRRAVLPRCSAAFLALLVGPVLGETDAALPALHRRGAAASRWSRCASRRDGRCASALWRRRRRSAPSASPPSGAGRTSGCRCRGPRALPRGRAARLRDGGRRRVRRRWLGARGSTHRPRARRSLRARGGRRGAAIGAIVRGRRRAYGRTVAPTTAQRVALRTDDADGRRRRAARSAATCASTRRRGATTPSGSPPPPGRAAALVVDRLERVGAGVYRTTEPIPVTASGRR